MKRQTTRLLHEERIADTVQFLAEHLDDTPDLGALADRACLSRFHFHRIFQALLGETVGELVRRLRLERAAHSLRVSRVSITQIALEAGYATHEAFIRAFRAAFRVTPSDIRRRYDYEGHLPTPNGVHFGDCSGLRFIAIPGEITMQIEIRELPARKAVCMTHRGPYYMIGKTFGEVGAWRKEAGVALEPFIGVYYDDPGATPGEELRADAGMLVPDDFTTEDPRVHLIDVAGGLYAVGTYIGAYDGITNAWMDMIGKWLPTSGYSWGDAPGIEIYVDDCDFVPVERLRTELCVPIKKATAE